MDDALEELLELVSVSLQRRVVTAGELNALEEELGCSLPESYRTVLAAYGPSELCGFLRLLAPEEVVVASEAARERGALSGAGEQELAGAGWVMIGESVEGDELHLVPDGSEEGASEESWHLGVVGGEEWVTEHHEGTLPELLLAWIEGSLESEVLIHPAGLPLESSSWGRPAHTLQLVVRPDGSGGALSHRDVVACILQQLPGSAACELVAALGDEALAEAWSESAQTQLRVGAAGWPCTVSSWTYEDAAHHRVHLVAYEEDLGGIEEAWAGLPDALGAQYGYEEERRRTGEG